jgi:tricorn protease-like protein
MDSYKVCPTPLKSQVDEDVQLSFTFQDHKSQKTIMFTIFWHRTYFPSGQKVAFVFLLRISKCTTGDIFTILGSFSGQDMMETVIIYYFLAPTLQPDKALK